ncbi:MAG: tetratricopeptide repeat protein [Anaerovibrio sp.]|uniref:tetratricopeptide repeat protein n=1 Tax=Anaerovibrio sp. TaxID=1872532 RepID=UPI0025EC9F44|nr:tetratricopeptide repeat protein [Anaerovibrio sp.]MCR5176985.1 tetratricopeptide repeat protein [Anaerovibrio sp.]
MDKEEFSVLVDMVLAIKANPPKDLFAKGYEDWHCRARLAHFLAMPELNRINKAKELFLSVIDIEPDEESSEDIEEKVYAMQHLSQLEKDEEDYENALAHINIAIETAESYDFLYKYILRGELWAERWNLLHRMEQTDEAQAEVDERIEVYKDIPIDHNSYLYYGYRFKAQLAAEKGVPLIAKDYMHMALKYMELKSRDKERLDKAFAAEHENISWILAEIDKATPNPDNLHWDI